MKLNDVALLLDSFGVDVTEMKNLNREMASRMEAAKGENTMKQHVTRIVSSLKCHPNAPIMATRNRKRSRVRGTVTGTTGLSIFPPTAFQTSMLVAAIAIASRAKHTNGFSSKYAPPQHWIIRLRPQCLIPLFGDGRREEGGAMASADDEDQMHSPPEYRSISDCMGGHHAGKFDFDSRLSGVTSLNYEKSIVFDDVTSVGKNEDVMGGGYATDFLVANIDDDDATGNGSPPTWASRPIDLEGAAVATSSNTGEEIRFSGVGSEARITVRNDEISWEPFYVSVEEKTGDSTGSTLGSVDSSVSVSPASGKLAPRGGCGSYGDECALTIRLEPGGSASSMMQCSLYVVVRTEQDAWCWPVVYPDRNV